MVSIHDVARRAQVSTATVSRVLNKKQGVVSISQKTREKVIQAAQELNYHPNFFARSLLRDRSYTLGLVIPVIDYSFFPEITVGIIDEVKPEYKLLLCCSSIDPAQERQEVETLLERRVDGFIVAPIPDPENLELYRRLKKEQIPFVFIDRYYEEANEFDTVVNNDREMAVQAVSHLIRLGHRRIGCIYDSPAISSTRQRLAGYREALSENGIPYAEELLSLPGETDRQADAEERGYEIMKRLLAIHDRPSAVFCLRDSLAFGAWRAARFAGLKVPEGLSIIGYDDIKAASLIQLTTVSQPKPEIGRQAARRVLELIDDRALPSQKTALQSRLIVRASTAAPMI